jgi:hypothetical protein
MAMRLLSFQVTTFRSVEDSGSIEVDSVTALIGTNESGKTNLLLPLWKLNPAKEGEINLTADLPRSRFTELRRVQPKPRFIEASFDVGDQLAGELSKLTGEPADSVHKVAVSRDFEGKYYVELDPISWTV